MADNGNLDVESSAVQKHLEIMQGVIQRMAENSRSCKLWCVTLVSAILVVTALTGDAEHALIALAPAILFYLLDAYYLGLERRFRSSYNDFVAKVRSGEADASDLFSVVPSGSTAGEFLWAMFKSFSVLPFYAVIVATILLAWLVVL